MPQLPQCAQPVTMPHGRPFPMWTHLVGYLRRSLPQARVCQYLLGGSRPELHPAPLVEDLARDLPLALGIPHGQGQTQPPPHLTAPLPAQAALPRQHQRVLLERLLLRPMPRGKLDQFRRAEPHGAPGTGPAGRSSPQAAHIVGTLRAEQ